MGKGSGTGGSAGGGGSALPRGAVRTPVCSPFAFWLPSPLRGRFLADGCNRKMLHNLCWDGAGLLQPGQAGAEGPLLVCLFPI